MKVKIKIISFATKNWPNAALRLRQQLHSYDFTMYNEDNLPEEYVNEFKHRFSDDGFAMWSWKPLLISNELEKLNEGDVLLYVDGGCSFDTLLNNKNMIAEFEQHIDQMSHCQFPLAIGYHPADIKNIIIQVKREVAEKFGLAQNNDFLRNWHHYEAGILVIQKTSSTMQFCKQWYLFMKDNYDQLFAGSRVNKTNQYPQFVANNGDQSVLQCMLYSQHKDLFYDIGSFWYRTNTYVRIKG